MLLAFLILDWTFLDNSTGYAAMVYLVYPAALATALVLLFDKATRSWSYKSGMAALREWLFCDTIVFLLLLAFLNLWMSGAGETYSSLFWDASGLALLFFVFWLLDRKHTRYRFLVTYGYLIVLPMLLLVWATVQDVPARIGVNERPAPVSAPEAEAASEAPSDSVTAAAPRQTDPSDVPEWARSEADAAPAAEPAPAEAAPEEQAAAQTSAAVSAPPAVSWWKSIWPFFAWAATFFVLELIGLIALEESDNSLALLLKDVVFVAGYMVLLLVAAR